MTQFTYDTAPARYPEGGGIRFACRCFEVPEHLPLVFFQHFTGTLDDHGPALSDAFSGDREVISFNNAGVATSTGTVPGTTEAMSRDAIRFTGALGLTTIDVVRTRPRHGLHGRQSMTGITDGSIAMSTAAGWPMSTRERATPSSSRTATRRRRTCGAT